MSKCAKILYIKVSDRMAYADSADPDQTSPEEQSDQGIHLLASVAQLDAHLTCDQEVAGSTPRQVGNILSWRFDHEIFSQVIISLPLIQEGQLPVSGKTMSAILVNRLDD